MSARRWSRYVYNQFSSVLSVVRVLCFILMYLLHFVPVAIVCDRAPLYTHAVFDNKPFSQSAVDAVVRLYLCA